MKNIFKITFKHFLILLLLVSISFSVSTKNVNYFEVEFEKSGKIIAPSKILDGSLSFYIPKEAQVIYSNLNYSFKQDEFGNKKVYLDLKNIEGKFEYKFVFKVKNNYHLPYKDKENKIFKSFTSSIDYNEEMKSFSLDENNFFEKINFFLNWIDKNLIYEKRELRDIPLNSSKVWNLKRGVCGEFSNLMASFLKLNGYPVKYVVGYALPSFNESLWGHAWLEVYYNGMWYPLDPTWNMFYYVDATHIKFAELLDAENFRDNLEYKSYNQILWYPDEVKIKILNYTTFYPSKFKINFTKNIKSNETFLSEIEFDGICNFNEIFFSNCLGKNEIRKIFVCKNYKLFFYIDEIKDEFFACEFTIQDAYGNLFFNNFTVFEKRKNFNFPNITIKFDGSNLVVNAERDLLVFSENFTEYNYSNYLIKKIGRDGKYKLNFYYNNKIISKIINVNLNESFEETLKGFSIGEESFFQKIINFLFSIFGKMFFKK